MKSLKQILKNAVIYTGLLTSLTFGAYRCGDGSEPNPSEDSQVQIDSGYDARTLKDVLISDVPQYPDANGDNISNGDDEPNGDKDDKDVLDGGYDTGNDTGYDACVGCDIDSTDIFD